MITGVAKAMLAYYIAAAVVAFVVSILVGTAFAITSGIVVFLAVLGAALLVGVGLNVADEHWGGTRFLQQYINKLQEPFHKKISQMKKEIKETEAKVVEVAIGSGKRMAKRALNSFIDEIKESIVELFNPSRYLKRIF